MGNEFVGHLERIFGPTNHILRESSLIEFFEKNIFSVEISKPVEISAPQVRYRILPKIDFFQKCVFSLFEPKNHFFCSKMHKKFFFWKFLIFSFFKQKIIFLMIKPHILCEIENSSSIENHDFSWKIQFFHDFRKCFKFSQKIARSYHVCPIWLVQDVKTCFKKPQTKGFDLNTHIAFCILEQLLPLRPIFAFWELQKASQAWKIKIMVDFANASNFLK